MSPPLHLVLEVARYVRQQAEPVSTATVAEWVNRPVHAVGGALVTARGRGYVSRGADRRWGAGPIEPGSAVDVAYRMQRKCFARTASTSASGR
jgi:hypothetical protein